MERQEIPDPWHAQAITDTTLDILCQHQAEEIALNATGGTKLMAIAAFEAFRSNGSPIYYIHPNQDHLIWLQPKGPGKDLDDRLKLKDYLMAYGASEVAMPEIQGVAECVRQLIKDLMLGLDKYADELATLNYLAYKAEKSLKVRLESQHLSRPGLMGLLNRFESAGLCRLAGGILAFPDESARFMTNGGWLEHHAYVACLGLKQKHGIKDIGRNIEIKRQAANGGIVRNELDLALLKGNRLHIIECKTNQMDKEADILYKMDSLRDLVGGLKAKAMLVSFNRLDKASCSRAQELNIRLCCANDLQRLSRHIGKWLNGS